MSENLYNNFSDDTDFGSGSDDSDGGNSWIGAAIMGFITAISNLWSQHQTNKANKELAELSYQRQIEQTNLMNEYNSESAKMSRLAQAGLNPMLVYGGSTEGSKQSVLPQYNNPTMKAPQFESQQMLGMIQALSTLRTQSAQRELLKQQANKEEQQANAIWTRNQMDQMRVYYWSLLTGQRPTDMSDSEYQALLESPTARKYSSEYNTRIAQGEMFDSMTALNKLNYQDRQKYLSSTLQARVQAELLYAQGMDIDLAMKKVQAAWQEKLIKRGYNLQIWNTVFRGMGAVAGLAGGAGMLLRNFGSPSREFFGPGGELTGGYIDSFNW